MGDDVQTPRKFVRAYSPEEVQMLIDLLPQVDRLTEIAAIMGRRTNHLTKIAQPFIDMMRAAGTLPHCSCGKPRFHPSGCFKLTPDRDVELFRLLTECESLRLIAKIMGEHQSIIAHAAKPHIERLRAAGTLPHCSCGKPRFHRYGCNARSGFWEGPLNTERLGQAKILIMEGVPFREIAKRLKCDPSVIRRYLSYLTPDDRAQRKQLESLRVLSQMGKTSRKREALRRLKAALAVPVAVFRPRADALWSRINSLAPGWLEPHQRDDVVSEVYARVLAGEISEADLTKENVRRVASAETRGDIGKFGMRSLDAPLNSDSAATLADMIEDPQALDAFDRIFEDDFYD